MRWFFVFALFGSAASAQTSPNWVGSSNGSWLANSNWSGGIAPNSINTPATISATGSNYTITASGSSSIAVSNLDVTSSAAQVLFDFTSSSASLNLNSGTSNWTAGNIEFRNSSGISGNGSGNTTIAISSSVELLFSTTAFTRSITNATVNNSGTIHATSGALATAAVNLTNQNGGVIHADGAEIDFNGGTNLTNSGTIRATGSNGMLRFAGSFTSANLGSIDLVNGGQAEITGTIDATGGLNKPTGGSFQLLGGTINNGRTATGALTFTNSGGVLNNVSVADDLTLAANTSITLRGGTTFSGSNVNLGTNAVVNWQQNATWANKTIAFGTFSDVILNAANSSLTVTGGAATGEIDIFDNGSGNTALSLGGNITHTSANAGTIYASTLTNTGTITNNSTNGTLQVGSTTAGYNTTNNGTITVNGSGALINLDGNVTNLGSLQAINGSLEFRGNTTETNLNGGALDITSGTGHAYLAGTVTNSSSLNAPHTGVYELLGGTISGGSIAAGALTFTTSGGTLSHVSLLGTNIALPSGTNVAFTNGANFANTLTLGTNATIFWRQAGTLVSNTLSFGSNSVFYLNATGASLTLDSNSQATGDIDVTDGGIGDSFTNQGTINHSLGVGTITPLNFTNDGTITVSSGSLVLGTTSAGATFTTTHRSSIHLTGGNVTLASPSATPIVNNGLLDIQSGLFTATNHLTNSGSSRITGAGSITGTFELAGGTLAPGNSGIGTLTFTAANFAVTQASTLAVDIGGSSSDQINFISPTSTVNIGGGLLALSLNLLSAPIANTTFNLISVTGGSFGISGSFFGLPNTGNTLIANFGATPFTFSVNYASNLVSLTYSPAAIPEPSTYALLVVGLLAIGWANYRRRARLKS